MDAASFSRVFFSAGLFAETEDAAIKEIIADQIKVAMDKKGFRNAKPPWPPA